MKDRIFDPYADFEEELAFEVRRPRVGRPAASRSRPPAARPSGRRPPGRPGGRRPPRPPFRRPRRWPGWRGPSLTLGLAEPEPEPAAAPADAGPDAQTESRPCPQPAGTATDRCSSPQPCPALPDLRCVTRVSGIPFHYVEAVGRDGATGLQRVTRRKEGRTQRMVPRAVTALEAFVRNARTFGLPFDVILTLGSLYCRCSRVNGQPSTALSNHSYGDAIDVAGVRWRTSGGPASRVRETIVHNFQDREQRA
ncbi:MAG TPA: hypothetical protein VGG03_10730, partial [Thermoanaerobaculia bacterium]